ncbi:MAG: biopolymer transporter ExbD [Kiritimatiellia bacterium]
MRLRKTKKKRTAAVILSPLIDCVFLLLIFFLVTSMIKRYERMIPVKLADASALPAANAVDEVFRLAVSREGNIHAQTGRGSWGAFRFAGIGEPADFFADLLKQYGPDYAIEVRVQRGTPFQTVIYYQDYLEDALFRNVSFRVMDRADELER